MKTTFKYLIAAAVILMAGCRETQDPLLSVSPTRLEFDAAGGKSQDIEITSNILWRIDRPDWLDVSTDSEKGKAPVTVTAKDNTTTSPRYGLLKIIAATGTLSAEVEVSQKESTLIKINNREIKGVTAPVAGATPVKVIEATQQYKGEVAWTPASSTFAYDTTYAAVITLTANEGYTLHGVVENYFTVAGADPVTNAANNGVVTAQFPETAPAPVSIAAIAGVTAPVLGATPVTAITETAQYDGTVEWSPAVTGTFAAVTAYTATITLTPKTGFTLTGVSENFFTVAGATDVSNEANSYVITAVFPATGAAPGSEDHPFIVNSPATLQKVGSGTDGWTLDKHYRQTENITLTGNWTPVGTSLSPFTGSYDGGGYSIANLTISGNITGGYLGLFGRIGADGAVRNVALRNVNINSTSGFVGGIAGWNAGTIENCYVTGKVSSKDETGGVAGVCDNGVIKNCYSTCDVTCSGGQIGGITGLCTNTSRIAHCYATGKISGTVRVGGIAGSNGSPDDTIERCVALNPEVSASEGATVGRITGRNLGNLSTNFGFIEMTLTGSSGNVTPTPSATGVHGANLTRDNANTSTGWIGTMGFDTDLWDIAPNRLPYLKTTKGGAFKEEQDAKVN